MSHSPTPAQLLSPSRRPPRIGTLSVASSEEGRQRARKSHSGVTNARRRAGCGSLAKPAPSREARPLRRGREGPAAAVAREGARRTRARADTDGGVTFTADREVSGENAQKLAKVWGPAVLKQEVAIPPPAYPKEVPQGEGEAHGQGHGAQAAIPPLVVRGKDAEHELERQEDLDYGGLAHAHARVQLGRGRRREAVSRAATALPPQGFPAGPLRASLPSEERR